MYKHTQIGHVILVSMAISSAVLLMLHLWIAAIAVIVPVAILFSTLTIRIENGYLTWSFGPGLFLQKKVPLALVEDAQIVRNRWLHGWGIHYLGRSGWLYNVSGMRAVQIWLKDGRRFRLGSDEPEALVTAIKTASGK